MDIKANLLSQAIWSYAPESVSLFSFYFEGTKLAAFFTKTKHIGNKKKLALSVNIHTLEIKPCGLGSRIRDVCSPKIYYRTSLQQIGVPTGQIKS